MRVLTEETIADCEPPNNGSGPLWCFGAPLIARTQDEVFVSIMETGRDVPPLCNTRPRLFRRTPAGGWQMAWEPPDFREREPCPLVVLPRHRVFLSLNTSTTPAGTRYERCEPRLLEFSQRTFLAPVTHLPPFPPAARFTDHSYRGIAADGQRGEILLLHIDAQTSEYHYALMKSDGRWDAPGVISFPIRACYPQVLLRDRKAFVLAIGDIVEPVEEWRRYKRERTQHEWDYVFRRLFFTWTTDALTEPFRPPVEIDTVDATGGHITNLDLWLDASGGAHVLYLRQQTTPLLRDRYFPNLPLRTSLEHCTIREGHVTAKQTLMLGGEGLDGDIPQYARFHSTDGRRLFVVFSATSAQGEWLTALVPVLPRKGAPQRIPLQRPFRVFFTATERGGSAPSRTMHLLGTADDTRELRYAQVQV